ncbi:MAG: HPP family protein [Alphaproteobacteria bacterium]|nr:HPP family protein [Alphaproteobacteria bacterium]
MRFALAWIGTVVALSMAGVLVAYTDHPWLMASMGGSCVILFGMPDNEMAQPRSVFGGHVIASTIGLVFLHFGGGSDVASADLWMICAVATALLAMMLTRTIHSPAGANPIIVFAEKAHWHFLLSPLAVGLVTIFLVAWVANNWGKLPWRGSYPRRWL